LGASAKLKVSADVTDDEALRQFLLARQNLGGFSQQTKGHSIFNLDHPLIDTSDWRIAIIRAFNIQIQPFSLVHDKA